MEREKNNDIPSFNYGKYYFYRLFNKARELMDTVRINIDEPEENFEFKGVNYRLDIFYNTSMDAVYVARK